MTLSGTRASAAAALISSTACPSEVPGARLKEMVTDGCCCWCCTESGPTVRLMFATVSSGTTLPEVVRR